MEKTIHQYQPYEDAVRSISDDERQNREFAWAEASVEELYRDLGATVVGGLSYSGERPEVALFVHAKQSAAMSAFENRPA